MPIHKNTLHDIPFILINKTTGGVLTGASITGYRSLDGNSQEIVDGIISEIGNGQYLFEGLAADFNGDFSTGLLFVSDNSIPVHILLQTTYFQKDTAYDIPFLLINTSTGLGLTGASPSGIRCLDGGVQSSVGGTFEELGNGQYVFHATAEDFGADDIAGFLIIATNAVPIHLIIDLLESYSATDYLLDTPASVIATWITGVGLMTAPSAGDSWPLYVSSLPDGNNVEDNAGVIYNTTPLKDARDMKTGEVTQHYGIQIVIRALDEETGWDKCNTIAGNLDALHNQLVSKDSNTYKIHNVSRSGGIGSLGFETGTKKRRLFSMNFLISLSKI